MFKSRSLSANHSNFSPNQYRDTHRGPTDIWDSLVRITYIMLKIRFFLTNSYSSDILALLIRIEDSIR